MNKTVTVTGMEMRTKVSTNLLISGDTLASTAVKADDTFSNAYVASTSGYVEPVSTINGVNYYYNSTSNVTGNGDAILDTYTEYDPSDLTDFNTNYGTTTESAVGYIDYVFQLKAISGGTDSEIRLTQLDLTYGGASPANNQKAYRVAIFAEPLGTVSAAGVDAKTAPTGGVGGLKAIYSPSGATNFTSGKAVKTDSTLDTVLQPNTAFSLDAGTNQTSYYKIVVRLWLEGEDNTCNNNTFMNLTDDWALDLKWDLVDDSEATAAYNKVSNLSLKYTASKTALTTSDTVNATTNTVVVNGVTYYQITGKTLGTSGPQLYATVTTLTTSSRVYTIADGIHPIDVTNQVTITAGA